MKPLSLKITSDCLLLCVTLTLLWGVTDSSTTSAPATVENSTIQRPTEEQSPANIDGFDVVQRTENHITLTWMKVSDIPTYFLKYTENDTEVENFINETETNVTVEINPLTEGTKYNFTVLTTHDEKNSSGFSDTAVTLPRNAEAFEAVFQTENNITLQWKSTKHNQYVLKFDSREESVTVSDEDPVEKTITGLTSMTKYNFTLFTVFGNERSSGVNTMAPTAPLDPVDFKSTGRDNTSITLQWKKVGDLLTYKLQYSGNEINVSASAGEELVVHKITNLTSGTEHTFTLFALFENVQSRGTTHTTVTAPRNVEELTVVGQDETSITLRWTKLDDILSYTLVYGENEQNFTALEDNEVTITELNHTTEYNFTLFTVFENVRSSGKSITAVTAPRNVEELTVVGQDETSITLRWTKLDDILSYMLVYGENEQNFTALEDNEVTITELNHTTKYNFILFTVFENVRSSGINRTAATAPPNTEEFTTAGQNESSITLRWKKVGDLLKYQLKLNEEDIIVTAAEGQDPVTHTIGQLDSGTLYSVSLFSLFENVKSSELKRQFPTVPLRVAAVTVTERTVNSVTLEWKSIKKNWNYYLDINGKNIKLDTVEGVVSYQVPSLQPGTAYPFRVTTLFSELSSTAYEDFTVTTINCGSATWHVTSTTIQADIEGLFSKAIATNGSKSHVSPGGGKVSFTDLYPGATYNLSLTYENKSKVFRQCDHILTINPPDLVAHCKYSDRGYSVLIGWNRPIGVWTEVHVNISGTTTKVLGYEKQNIVIPGFLPAKTFQVSVGTLSGPERRSSPYVFSCTTDPRGVIAGSVFGVLIFLALVCVVAFILLKRPDIYRRAEKPSIGVSKPQKSKGIFVGKFPDHFYELSLDDNRGFSQEYESLLSVGKEQTHRAADSPENKPRNRFNNVLPYDWCRVKLNTEDANEQSDYINASYMPGYNSSREYIATQGPLPSTVNDFWRMIWEQRVKGIVMVTNCIENGKTKCEQYWPRDSKPRVCGEILVTLRSEQQRAYWTLREFKLEHTRTSEERTVNHFHFTAWPDHGVPLGTEALIQFRELVRQHIEREGTRAPTVVHCSAGVGRTGTIIALDVLLQQLEREQAVDINAFVHKMRLNRPHMVQTESQYVFLHQCIMDCLQQQQNTEDNIYDNDDMLYVNATALREFKNSA